MKEIYIKYDPYEMITEFEINGISVSEMKYSHPWLDKVLRPDSLIPLQSWVDPVASEKWDGLLSFLEKTQDDSFSISFYGRKKDFEDLKASLSMQNSKMGNVFELCYPKEKQQFMMDDSNMKQAIDEVVSIMTQPRFAEMVEASENTVLKEKYAAMQQNISDINNKEFRIVFTGTYSTGKSTVINALIGKNILPNSDDSCTDKICHIKHSDDVKYARVAYIKNDSELESKECNSADETHEAIRTASEIEGLDRIEVFVDMSHLQPTNLGSDFKVVFIDTPGTESEEGDNLESKDEEQTHLELTRRVLSSDEKEMVVLVSDKKNVSTGITKILDIFEDSAASDHGCYNDRFLFVLNQCDTYDYRVKNKDLNGRYEGLENEVLKYKETIGKMSHGTQQRNIANPRIFPLSAATALAIRLGCVDPSHKPARESEERCYYEAYDNFCNKLTDHRVDYYVSETVNEADISRNYLLDTLSDLSDVEKQRLQALYDHTDNLPEYLLLHSGILSLETAISTYIEKYAFPLKMRKILRSFKSILVEINEESTSYLHDLETKKVELSGKKHEIDTEKKIQDKDTKRKIKLDKAKEAMKKQQELLEGISLELPELDVIRSLFYKVQEDSKDFFEKRPDGSLVKDITKEKAEDIKEKIKSKIEDLANKVTDEVNKVKKKKSQQADVCATEFNKYLEQLKNDGLLDVGSFNIRNTVQYQDIIGNGEFTEYSKYARDIKNPNKEHIETEYGVKHFFVSLGKSIKTIFEPTTINRVDAHKYREDLFTTLDGNIGTLISSVKKAYASDISDMKTNMSNRMQQVIALIETVEKAIQERDAKIASDLATEDGYNQKKAKLEGDCDFLAMLIGKLNVIEQGGN